MPKKRSAKPADTVEVTVAQSAGEVSVFDGVTKTTYDVVDHKVQAAPEHAGLVAHAGAGEPYESDEDAMAADEEESPPSPPDPQPDAFSGVTS